GHGEVIAEKRDKGLPSYLGLKFPNTDIPAQARRLYLKSRTRGIYDVDDTPSAIYPTVRKQDGKPLDLSNSFLRSVSPIHIRYLKNMGVRASFSISVVIKDKLWGLILCHHTDAPVRLNLYQRRACQFIGRMFSHRLESRISDQRFRGFRDRLKTIQAMVNTLMATNDLHHAMDMNTARILSALSQKIRPVC
ncbi:MAG: GAF domain-containing protein, partial [Owenweeksia sp.]